MTTLSNATGRVVRRVTKRGLTLSGCMSEPNIVSRQKSSEHVTLFLLCTVGCGNAAPGTSRQAARTYGLAFKSTRLRLRIRKAREDLEVFGVMPAREMRHFPGKLLLCRVHHGEDRPSFSAIRPQRCRLTRFVTLRFDSVRNASLRLGHASLRLVTPCTFVGSGTTS